MKNDPRAATLVPFFSRFFSASSSLVISVSRCGEAGGAEGCTKRLEITRCRPEGISREGSRAARSLVGHQWDVHAWLFPAAVAVVMSQRRPCDRWCSTHRWCCCSGWQVSNQRCSAARGSVCLCFSFSTVALETILTTLFRCVVQ